MKKSLLLLMLPLVSLLIPSLAYSSDVSVRVVGGQLAPAGSWSAQTLVRPGGQYLCGGTLVASRWVLSAAHCFKELGVLARKTTAAVGAKNQSSSGTSVAAIYTHKGFSKKALVNDIALLRLRSGSLRAPARIARVADRPYFDGIGEQGGDERGFVAGWGKICEGCSESQLLRQAEVPVISKEECSSIFRSYWHPSMICAGRGITDTCDGDSGGPLETEGAGGRRILVGIVSWGVECASEMYPGVYTDVTYHLPWIGSHIVSRVQAPREVSFRGSALFMVRSSDPLNLPTVVRPVVVGTSASKRSFSVSRCSLPAGSSCAIRVRARSPQLLSATLELRNRAGVVMDRVTLRGRK